MGSDFVFWAEKPGLAKNPSLEQRETTYRAPPSGWSDPFLAVATFGPRVDPDPDPGEFLIMNLYKIVDVRPCSPPAGSRKPGQRSRRRLFARNGHSPIDVDDDDRPSARL